MEQPCSDDLSPSERGYRVFRSCNNKVGKILRWSRENDENLEELRQLALTRGGLFNASMRQKAWPVLLGVKDAAESQDLGSQSTNTAPLASTDLDMIRKDVQRSAMFRYVAVTGSIVKGEQQSEHLQNKLTAVLQAALSDSAVNASTIKNKKDTPCYYQGLHDVAFVLLFNLNYDEGTTTAVLRQLLHTHLQDAARKDFGNVMFLLDAVLMPFLYAVDPQVYQAIVESDVPLTNAILPWVITLFAHPVQDQTVASRLMDAFMAHSSKPLLPFYVAVSLLTHPSLRQSLLAASYDPVMMHMAIHGLPGEMKNDFTTPTFPGETVVTSQEIIDAALSLMSQYPPEALLGFVGIGLQKRSRRRLVHKARNIAIMNTSLSVVDQASFWMQAQRLVVRAKHAMGASRQDLLLQARLQQVWTTIHAARDRLIVAQEDVSQALAKSKSSLMALQIVMLFILMPQQYVHEFYCLVQLASRYLSKEALLLTNLNKMRLELSPVFQFKQTDQNSKNYIGKAVARYYSQATRDDDDMPGMVKSLSTTSFSEFDNGV